MKKLKVDLHAHTSFSDGELSPYELIKKAENEGIDVLGVVDHDTMEAAYHIPESKIEIVIGTELSLRDGRRDIHLLVYFPDKNSELEETLRKIREVRFERIKKIIKKLNEMNIKITLEDVIREGNTLSFGRPHIARVLLKKGYVASIDEAFDRYIGNGKPAYIPKFKLTPKQGIELALKSNGIPVIAHPGIENIDYDYLDYLKSLGMKGVEVFYPDHDEEKEKYYMEYALRNKMFITGGSDYHGDNHDGKEVLAKKTLPYKYFIELKKYKYEVLGSK